MPGTRLFIPGGTVGPVGPAGPAGVAGPPGPPGPPGTTLSVFDHGVLVDAAVASMDFEGIDVVATSIAAGQIQVTVPPPPPPAFAYFAGGTNGGGVASAVNQSLAFASDNTAMVAKGSMTAAGGINDGVNSSLNGYFVSNYAVNKLIFATDAVAMTNVNAPLYGITSQGSVNSTDNGYFAGSDSDGNTGSIKCSALNFAIDTAAMLAKGDLTVARQYLAGANSTVAGYFAGGVVPVPGTVFDICDKLLFASDTVAMTAAGVLTAIRSLLAGANSTTFGYFSGGSSTGATGSNSIVTSRLTFSSDLTTMVAKGNLTLARMSLAGANSTLKAYYSGGLTGISTASVVTDALTFATDSTNMVTRGSLIAAKQMMGSCQSGGIL
jgi:hypothetical protein